MKTQQRVVQEKIIALMLANITAANGYHNTLLKVTKKAKTLEQIASYPEGALVTGPEMNEQSSEEGLLHRTVGSFGAVLYFKADSDTDDDGRLSDEYDHAKGDLEKFFTDETILSQLYAATEAKDLALKMSQPIMDYETNTGFAEVDFEITYYKDTTVYTS